MPTYEELLQSGGTDTTDEFKKVRPDDIISQGGIDTTEQYKAPQYDDLIKTGGEDTTETFKAPKYDDIIEAGGKDTTSEFTYLHEKPQPVIPLQELQGYDVRSGQEPSSLSHPGTIKRKPAFSTLTPEIKGFSREITPEESDYLAYEKERANQRPDLAGEPLRAGGALLSGITGFFSSFPVAAKEGYRQFKDDKTEGLDLDKIRNAMTSMQEELMRPENMPRTDIGEAVSMIPALPYMAYDKTTDIMAEKAAGLTDDPEKAKQIYAGVKIASDLLVLALPFLKGAPRIPAKFKLRAYEKAKSSVTKRMTDAGLDAATSENIATKYMSYVINKGGGYAKVKAGDFRYLKKAMQDGWKIIIEQEMKPGAKPKAKQGAPAQIMEPAKDAGNISPKATTIPEESPRYGRSPRPVELNKQQDIAVAELIRKNPDMTLQQAMDTVLEAGKDIETASMEAEQVAKKEELQRQATKLQEHFKPGSTKLPQQEDINAKEKQQAEGQKGAVAGTKAEVSVPEVRGQDKGDVLLPEGTGIVDPIDATPEKPLSTDEFIKKLVRKEAGFSPEDIAKRVEAVKSDYWEHKIPKEKAIDSLRNLARYSGEDIEFNLERRGKIRDGKSRDTIEIYRGESAGSEGDNYYSLDKEWARQFTQSGKNSEIKSAKIDRNKIYRRDILPEATSESDIDNAIKEAKKQGYDAVWVDEGKGQPNSVYVIDKKSLSIAPLKKPLSQKAFTDKVKKIKPRKSVKFDPNKHSIGQWIKQIGGLNFKKEMQKGELDTIRQTGGGQFIVNKSGGGVTLDEAVVPAREIGFLTQDEGIQELYDKIIADLSHKTTGQRIYSMQKDIEIEPPAETTDLGTLITDENLKVGDRIRIDDEWFELKGLNNDGNMILQDGSVIEVDPFAEIRRPVTDIDKSGKGKELTPEIKGEKELWQMTGEEFKKQWDREMPSNLTFKKSGKDILADTKKYGMAGAEHKWAIEGALKKGVPVPPEVLKDYPELQKQSTPEVPEILKLYRAEKAGRGIKTDAIPGGIYHFTTREQAELWAGKQGKVVETIINTEGASIQDVTEGNLTKGDSDILIRRDPEGSGKILEVVTFKPTKKKPLTKEEFTLKVQEGRQVKGKEPKQTAGLFTQEGFKGKLTPEEVKAQSKEIEKEEGKGDKLEGQQGIDDLIKESVLQSNHEEYKSDKAALAIAQKALRQTGQLDLPLSGGTGVSADKRKTVSGITTLGLGISAEFAKTGRIDLRGQKLETVRDLAVLAQVYRSPQYETLRFFYVKNGKIKDHYGVTSRLPGTSRAFLKDVARDIHQITIHMEKIGADGLWCCHNHPSGNPAPSKDDLAVTSRIGFRLQEKGKNFLGHVVINSGEYALINAKTLDIQREGYEVYPIRTSDIMLTPAIDHPLLGMPITKDRDIVKIGKKLQAKKGFMSVVYQAGHAGTRAIQEIPEGMLKDTKGLGNYLRGRAREFGSSQVFLAVDEQSLKRFDRDAAISRLTDVVKEGVVKDAVVYNSNNGDVLSVRGNTLLPAKLQEIKAYKVSEEVPGYENKKRRKGPLPLKEVDKAISEAKKAVRAKEKEKADERVEKIKTAKEILDRRRSMIRSVQSQFNLTDNDLRKITKQDIRLMNNHEFKQFLDNIQIKAVEYEKHAQAKAELMDLINQRQFKKWDNLRAAYKMPTISKMTTEQLRIFDDMLSHYAEGDEFLSKRMLELVDRTELVGTKTIREAREHLAKDINMPISRLDSIKTTEMDRLRYDTDLAKRNPFYNLLVTDTIKYDLQGTQNYLEVEKTVNRLAKAARKGTGKSVSNFFVPQDKAVFEYIEAGAEKRSELAMHMTPEELDFANFISVKGSEAMNHLIEEGTLKSSRFNDAYITHIRKGLLESLKDDGLKNAIKGLFARYRQDEQIFNILDSNTGDILPLEKFFKYSMFRTGELQPSTNVAKSFLIYWRTFEKKKALDRLIPKMSIYIRALETEKKTPRGLTFDISLERFFKEWMNTKKGRHVKLIAKQGGNLDLSLRGLNALVTIKDLALNIPVGVASNVGEAVTNYIMLGKKANFLGLIRKNTKQGRAITSQYKNFVGKSVWEELTEASKDIGDRLSESMFGLFQYSMTSSNKTFLLGSLTKEEFQSGAISPKRLAEIKKNMGEYRYVEGAKSIIGATPEGRVFTKYKTWAVPPLTSTYQNIKKLIGRKIGAKEAWQLYRSIEVTAAVLLVGSLISSDDRSFIGTFRRKLYREALSILGATSPKFWVSTPRLWSWMQGIVNAIGQILEFEKYKTKDEYKGVRKLKRELTPRAISQFQYNDDGSVSRLANQYYKAREEKDSKVMDSIKKEIEELNVERKKDLQEKYQDKLQDMDKYEKEDFLKKKLLDIEKLANKAQRIDIRGQYKMKGAVVDSGNIKKILDMPKEDREKLIATYSEKTQDQILDEMAYIETIRKD